MTGLSPAQREYTLWGVALVMASVLFLAVPGVDLAVNQSFYRPDHSFAGKHYPWMGWVYQAAPRLGQALFVTGLLVCLARWVRPVQVPRWLWRSLAAWMLVVVLGVGLLVHEVLKNQVGRPRPQQVVQMGGSAPYVPIYAVSAWCPTNCSFVSGHAAIGFSIVGFGMWAPPRRRRRWWLAGMALGAGIGWVRIAQGGHFLSDVVFSGLAIWGTAILIRRVWLHWRLRRLRTRQC